MATKSHSLSVYFQKLKHLGVKWGLGRFFNILMKKVFQIHSHKLIIFYNEVIEMPPFPPDVDAEYRNLTDDEVDKVVALNFVELSRERIQEFFRRNSECMGAFAGEQLVGMIWAHHNMYDWPFFKFTLDLKEDEGYIGNDYVIPEYRGKNLHLALLSRAMRVAYFRNATRGYGSAHVDNIASIKGIKKFGGKPLLFIRTIKLHKLTIYRKIQNVEDY